MDDQNQTPMPNGGAQQGAGNPFGDPATGGNPVPADDNAAQGVTDTPPWLTLNPDQQQQPDTSTENSAPMENTFDPFSNPFDSTPSVDESPASRSPVEEAPAYDAGSAEYSGNTAMDLLLQLQKQYEYEEQDYQDTLRMHEGNIKAEQEAIRELRQKRRETTEEMKKVILGLEKMVGLTREKPAAQQEVAKKEPKRQEKRPDMQSAKKVNSDDFFTAA